MDAQRRARLLVADDEPVSRLVAVRIFERLGCAVTSARDGSAALDLLGTRTFEMLVVDLQMPGLPGLELAGRLQRGRGPRPRVVALTSLRDPSLAERCAAHGVDALRVKPITPAQAQALLTALAPGPREVLDLELLDGSTCGGEPALIAALAEDYFEFVPRATADLGAALASGDQGLVSKVAHRMAGGLGVAGAGHGLKLARRLERLCAAGELHTEPDLPAALLEELNEAARALRALLERTPLPRASNG